MISVVEGSRGSLLDRGTMGVIMGRMCSRLLSGDHGNDLNPRFVKALGCLVTVLLMDEKSVWKDLE